MQPSYTRIVRVPNLTSCAIVLVSLLLARALALGLVDALAFLLGCEAAGRFAAVRAA